MAYSPPFFKARALAVFLDFLISPAFAQAATTAAKPTPSLLEAFWPLLVMIPMFYFLLIRPQMKRQKEQRQTLEKLAKGDEIVVSGGLAGRIINIGEIYLTVEIAEGVSVKIQKNAVATVLPKGTLKSL